MSGDYADQVRAWAEALRSGSTQTWSDFRRTAPDSVANGTASDRATSRDAVPAPTLPTAAQLEVVRRLADTIEVPDFASLADRVLATAGPGRGRVDVPLPWDAPPEFGSPAVPPEQLHPDELLRVVAGALTGLLVEQPLAPAPVRRRSWRPFRKQFVLLGAPSAKRAIGRALVARGLREGGPKPTYLVFAGPLEDVMAQRWAARIRAGSTIRWRRFWRYCRNHDRIPPAIQAPLLADRLAREVGGGRVHVVLAEDTAGAMATVADILGVRAQPVEEPAELVATDLLRVVNGPLTLAAGRDGRSRIVEQLWPGLVPDEQPRRLGAPKAHLDWAVRAAERQAERLDEGSRTAGYAVHGDPAIVVPDRQAQLQRSMRRGETLELGLHALGRAWDRHVGPQEREVR